MVLWLVQGLALLNNKQEAWTEKYFQGLCRGSLNRSRMFCESVLREATLLVKKHLEITSQIWISHQFSKFKKQELNCEQDKAVISVKIHMQLQTTDGILN